MKQRNRETEKQRNREQITDNKEMRIEKNEIKLSRD